MKKLNLFTLFILSISILYLLSGCSKDSDNPADPNNVTTSEAKLTLNGAGYTNKSVTLSNGACSYSLTDNITGMVFSGKADADSLYLIMYFTGKATGTYNWNNDDIGLVLYRSTTSGMKTYASTDQGTTSISSFGSVGGKVEGSVSGKIFDVSNMDELNISGTIKATRIPDEQ